ncbi:MAG: cell division protein FtsQ/DivIB [Rhodothermia bacterium]|nr:MAG: cell division protein FtsQ/DivIB [Rhodothermia bacterium]
MQGLPGYMRRSGFLEGILVLIVLTTGILGWGWLMQVTVERVDVRGTVNALPGEIRELAGVDSGDVMFQIQSDIVAERVARHPWVAHTSITRLPTGVLILGIRERVPVVQVLSPSGRPSFYLDRDGYPMHPSDSSSYDVPFLSGYRDDFHPGSPSADEQTLSFLAALDAERDNAGILISEIVFREGEVWLWLEPSGRHGSTPVRLGADDFDEKLKRLDAFWTQRMARSQDREFQLIDLRFSSQIISREEKRDTPARFTDP